MTGFLVVVGLFLVAVVVLGIRYDRRQRRLGYGTSPAKGGQRLKNQTQADKWGGPG